MLERAHACAFPRNDALMGAKKKNGKEDSVTGTNRWLTQQFLILSLLLVSFH